MTLIGKYLCNGARYIDWRNEKEKEIYQLLIHLLSLPHDLDEVEYVFRCLSKNSYDVSIILALACRETSPSLVEKIFSSDHHWNSDLSYYYPYLNPITLQPFLEKERIVDDDLLVVALTCNKPDLLRSLLNVRLSRRGDSVAMIDAEKISTFMETHPEFLFNKANLKVIRDFYGEGVFSDKTKRKLAKNGLHLFQNP